MKNTIPQPSFVKCEDNSLDMHWKNDRAELLVNFSSDINQDFSYYGDNYGDKKYNGHSRDFRILGGILEDLFLK